VNKFDMAEGLALTLHPSPSCTVSPPPVNQAAVSSAPTRPSGTSASSAKRKYGATVAFSLSEAASVRFTVTRSQPGRRTTSGRCVATTHANQHARRCSRNVSVPGSFTRSGHAARNSVHFSGRLNGKKLEPGSYQLLATPSAGGQSGAHGAATFSIVK